MYQALLSRNQAYVVTFLLMAMSRVHARQLGQAAAEHVLGGEHIACSALHHFSHKFTLDQATLEQSIALKGLTAPGDTGSGSTFSLFLQKLLTHPPNGRPLNVVVQGGSFSVGFGLQPGTNYLSRFVKVLNTLNPAANITGINSAYGSSRPCFGLLCAGTLMPPDQDVDLVLVEWNPNVGMDAEMMDPNTNHKMYERFIRRMLRWRGSPAVVVVNFSFPFSKWGHTMYFYKGTEDAYLVVGQYYSLPTISLRNALYLKQFFNQTGFGPEMRMSDNFHMNELGHSYMADSLAWLVRSTLESMCIHVRYPRLLMLNGQPAQRPELSQVLAKYAKQPPPLKIPMLESAESDKQPDKYKMCVLAENLYKYVGEHDDWVYAADDKHKSKFGYISTKKGSRMQLKIPRPELHTNETLVLYLSTLKSYSNMGAANVTCVSGCSCKPTTFESTWTMQVSLMSLTAMDIDVFSSDTCVLNVTHVGGATPSAKFKVTGFMLVVRDDLMNADQPEVFGNYGSNA